MKGFCDRNLHPAGKQAKGHKALDATAWTTKGVLILSLKQRCKYLNARFECNDIVISVYSNYPHDSNAKSSDTKCVTLTIR